MGFPYYFGYNHPYKVSRGSITLENFLPPQDCTEHFASEAERTLVMITKLWSTFGSQYDIGLMHGHLKTRFCPFRGGGDVYIMRNNLESCVVLATIPSTSADPGPTDSPESPVESLEVTPPRAGEDRCGAIENKVQHRQTDREVELQLQANMLLFDVRHCG